MNASEIRKKLGYSSTKELFAILDYSPSSMSQIKKRDALNGTENYNNILKVIILTHIGVNTLGDVMSCVLLYEKATKVSGDKNG